VRHVKTTLDPAICRGFYLAARNQSSRLVAQTGSRVIVTARGLNRCWERFVYIKELMHLFEDPLSATDNGDAFDELLGEFTGAASTTRSPQLESEIKCFWRALAALCPEELRKTFSQERSKNQIDDYSIALQLRIPEQYVPHLFIKDFEGVVQAVSI
jgi:hypothetical protein